MAMSDPMEMNEKGIFIKEKYLTWEYYVPNKVAAF